MAEPTVRPHKKARNDLTADYVRSLLNYDPETGDLTWKSRGSPAWDARFSGKRAGKVGKGGRIHVGINYRRYLAHRLIWLIVKGEWPAFEIDHIDVNGGNNRWPNLRPATSSENACNVGLSQANTSGLKGVSWSTINNGWIARITKNYKTFHLGTFSNKEDAHVARLDAEKELHGIFSHRRPTIFHKG